MNKQDLDEFIEHAELNFLPNALLWGDGWAGRAIEIAKAFRKTFEQESVGQYSDIVSDGGLDPRNQYDTAQTKRGWVGLTDEELPQGETYEFDRGVRWAEAKLKEKNT